MKRALIFSLVFLAPSLAVAGDTWTNPFPGVRQLARTTTNPNWRIHAVEVDLCAPGLSIRSTRSGEKGRTPSSFGSLVGADVVVNGDFFTSGYTPVGFAVGDGESWHGDPNTHGWIGFGPGFAEYAAPGSVSQPGWVHDAVGGNIMVVRDGVVTADNGSFCTTRHPRTVAGLSQDQRTLYLMVADGRSSSSVGMTCTEAGNVMKGLGAYNAINLDGGGSSAMWVRGEGVVNNPSDGSQRTVANHLGIVATGTGEPEACNLYGARLDAQFLGLDDFYQGGSSAGVPDVLVGDEFQGVLALTSHTPRRWRGTVLDYWFEDPFLRATDYTIESDHPVYDQTTWTTNSADEAPENPPKDGLGRTGQLVMHAYTFDETKRVLIDLKAERYSVGAVDHPDIRGWLRHIDDVYGEQRTFDGTPTNGNRFGEVIRSYAQVDILSPREWQFDDGGDEGWTACGEGSTTPQARSLAIEGCAASPPWTSVAADRYDQLVVRLGSETERLAVGIGDDLLVFEDLLAGDNVLELASAAAWTGDVRAFSLQGTASIDGLWFQSTTEEVTSSSSKVFLDRPALIPVTRDNPHPVETGTGSSTGGDDASVDDTDTGVLVRGDAPVAERPEARPGAERPRLEGDVIIADGGYSCTSAAGGRLDAAWLLVVVGLFGIRRRRSRGRVRAAAR